MSGDGSETGLGLFNTRLSKLRRLAVRPGLWPVALKGTIPSLEHADLPFGAEFRTVIDVGASRGQFASFAAHRFPDAAIICFEPLAEAADDLERLLGDRVEVRRVALGKEPGRATIHLSRSDDSSSLLPIGERQVAEFPGTAAVGTREITVSTLDQEFGRPLERPCLLKIDVQGLEADVLEGGPELLRQVDEALIECSFVELYEGQALAPAIITRVGEAGLMEASRGKSMTSRDGEKLQTDILFARG